MQPKIYLDHAATSPISESLADFHRQTQLDYPFNSETVTEGGLESKKKLDEAREALAAELNVQANKIIFCSGGSEANNAAIRSSAARKKQGVVWLSKTAHPSQKEVALHLGENWTIVEMPSEESGVLNISEMESCATPDLVIVEWVNSEAGFLQPLTELSETAKSKNKNVDIHVDGAQGFCKVKLPDLKPFASFTMSGHKIAAPIGVGALYVNHHENYAWLYGGGQEFAFRSGTVALPLILTFIEAVKRSKNHSSPIMNHGHDLNFYRYDDFAYSPWIFHLNTAPIDGEVLLHHLESKGLYIGLGSACSARRQKMSSTHKAMGLSEKQSQQSVRLSLGFSSTQEELDEALPLIKESLSELSRFF